MKKIVLTAIMAILVFCIVPLSYTQAMQDQPDRHSNSASDQPDNDPSGSLLAKGNEHTIDAFKKGKQQKGQNASPKDAWGDAEYPEDENDIAVDKKNNKHKKESPWSKDAWGDAEYPEE